MRLKAPQGRGHPVLKGVEVKPKDDGCYHFHHPADIEHLLALGYRDADAKEEQAAPVGEASPVLREGVVAALKQLGVALARVPDDAGLAQRLVDAVARQNEQTLEAVKRAERDTEERVLASLAAGEKRNGGKK